MLRDDPHDRKLRAHVGPEDWQNPTPSGRYNLVVIGGGTAGLITAAGAAGLGARVALIERDHLGGDCLNVGCVPSKALLRSAHVAAGVRDAGRFGVHTGGEPTVDFPAVMDRMRAIRARIGPVDSAERYTNELGVDVYLGQARFLDSETVEVDGDTKLRFKTAVIATGARAFVPDIPGLQQTGYLTNETVFDLRALPERMLVLGGGPIGCELAQAFRRFGARVTILEMADQFLPREDPDAARILLDALQRDGVDVRLRTTLLRTELGADGGRFAVVETSGDGEGGDAGKQERLDFDALLVGVGRAPNVEGLELERVGVEYDAQRGVHVDDTFRTTNRRIFAAGDVCMAYKFTHAAEFAARAVIQNALFFGRKRQSALTIPWCTYTDPEIAHVGLSERDAAAQGIEIDTYVRAFDEVDRAIAEGREEGFVKVHARKGKDEILGATIVAPNAGDLISEVSVAMAAGMGLGGLATVIHPYPTQADAIRQTANAYVRTRLTPTVAWIFERFLAFRR